MVVPGPVLQDCTAWWGKLSQKQIIPIQDSAEGPPHSVWGQGGCSGIGRGEEGEGAGCQVPGLHPCVHQHGYLFVV